MIGFNPKKCDYPLYGTSLGGYARRVDDMYFFVVAPAGHPDIQVGDDVPEGTEVCPANKKGAEHAFADRWGLEV